MGDVIPMPPLPESTQAARKARAALAAMHEAYQEHLARDGARDSVGSVVMARLRGEKHAQAFRIWREGRSVSWDCTISELAEATGIPYWAVHRIVREHAWPVLEAKRGRPEHQEEVTAAFSMMEHNGSRRRGAYRYGETD